MSSIKVIIVEDELIPAQLLKEMLEEQGVEVLEIIDRGEEAIDVCIEKKPDVIFMDVILSDSISGCEAAVAISRKNNHSKIIFLSAHITDEMVEYAMESHAIGYLTKPFNMAQIIANLKLATAHQPKSIEAVEKIASQRVLKDGYIYLTQQNRLLKNNTQVELTTEALKLIELLTREVNISVSNEQISMHIWGQVVLPETVRSLIHRVRLATEKTFIKNISRAGYMIEGEEQKSSDIKK